MPFAYPLARALLRWLLVASIGAHATASRAHEPDADEIALGSLIDAELAFAKMGWERGVREACLAHFARDGVVFEPKPTRLREAWSARPAPADPLALRLEWKPAQAGVARSHDLGYTTGPFTAWSVTQPERKRHGVFFSVWQRSAAGRWEVILDAGIGTPGVVDFASLGAAPRSLARGRARATERARLLAREADAFGGGADGVSPTRYAHLLADDARLHRDGVSPLASRGRVAREVAQRMTRVSWMPLDARVSAAGDLAVSYGRYREVDRVSTTPHEGYYAHLWLRDAAGQWRLAYDVALPEPPKAPS
jgi:ketosteroid isomerase-like protein